MLSVINDLLRQSKPVASLGFSSIIRFFIAAQAQLAATNNAAQTEVIFICLKKLVRLPAQFDYVPTEAKLPIIRTVSIFFCVFLAKSLQRKGNITISL
ncbi:hypothetical protein VU07_00710 [Desulfobulbus sp. F4]|nr:hypothetical protein [Desulfobulbus sp. F3]MCW5200328.1 hypothetical protein [Desulfobulbus sp. F4]